MKQQPRWQTMNDNARLALLAGLLDQAPDDNGVAIRYALIKEVEGSVALFGNAHGIVWHFALFMNMIPIDGKQGISILEDGRRSDRRAILWSDLYTIELDPTQDTPDPLAYGYPRRADPPHGRAGTQLTCPYCNQTLHVRLDRPRTDGGY